MQTCPLWRGFAFLGLPDARGGLTPEVISLIPVSWKTAGDITHSSGGYISSCALAASCAMHRNKWGKARANPHSEHDHRYRRRTHRGECGAVPSSALSKNHSCCRINSDPRPVFRQRRALLGSRGGESHRNLGRRGGSRTLTLSELVSPRVFAYTQARPCKNAMRSFARGRPN